MNYSEIDQGSSAYWDLVREIIDKNRVAVFGYIDDNGVPNSFSCHYVRHDQHLIFRSSSKSLHGSMLVKSPLLMSCSIWTEDVQTSDLRGLQLRGKGTTIRDVANAGTSLEVHSNKFGAGPSAEELIDPDVPSHIFHFDIEELKLFAGLSGNRCMDTSYTIDISL